MMASKRQQHLFNLTNVFFQHIYDLAGPYGAAGDQFVTLANQWRRVVSALGGSATPWEPGFFDYRSFRIRDLEPVASGVHQPEAAGAIGYVLQNAWLQTGDGFGGFHLFETKAAAEGYLGSDLATGLVGTDGFTDFRIEHFDVLDGLSARTGIDTLPALDPS